jgi:hypothetical protein
MLDFNQLPRFNSQAFRITSLLSEWAVAYEVHYLDIERQIRIAHAWCDANKRKAPKKDPVRFLFNWMRKAKEYGNLKPVRTCTYKEYLPRPEEIMDGNDWARMKAEVFKR